MYSVIGMIYAISHSMHQLEILFFILFLSFDKILTFHILEKLASIV